MDEEIGIILPIALPPVVASAIHLITKGETADKIAKVSTMSGILLSCGFGIGALITRRKEFIIGTISSVATTLCFHFLVPRGE